MRAPTGNAGYTISMTTLIQNVSSPQSFLSVVKVRLFFIFLVPLILMYDCTVRARRGRDAPHGHGRQHPTERVGLDRAVRPTATDRHVAIRPLRCAVALLWPVA